MFLLGAAWFERESFVVEQYFLSEVTEERAFLAAINRRFSQFDFAVSFHGNPTTPAEDETFSAAILVLHGADDPLVPSETLAAFEEAMKARQANWELVSYGGAVHSFTDPRADGSFNAGVKYHERTAARAFERCRTFLAETLAR